MGHIKGVLETNLHREQSEKDVIKGIEERLSALKARAEELDDTLGHDLTFRSHKPLPEDLKQEYANLAAAFPRKYYDKAVKNLRKKESYAGQGISTGRRVFGGIAELASPITFGGRQYREEDLTDIIPEHSVALGNIKQVHARAPNIEFRGKPFNEPELSKQDMPHWNDPDALTSGTYKQDPQTQRIYRSKTKAPESTLGKHEMKTRVPIGTSHARPHIQRDSFGRPAETFAPPQAEYRHAKLPDQFRNQYVDDDGKNVDELVEYTPGYVPGYYAKDYLLDRDEPGSEARRERRLRMQKAKQALEAKQDPYVNNLSEVDHQPMQGDAIPFPYIQHFGHTKQLTGILPTQRNELEAEGEVNYMQSNPGLAQAHIDYMKNTKNQADLDDLSSRYEKGQEPVIFHRPNLPGDNLKRPPKDPNLIPEDKDYLKVFHKRKMEQNKEFEEKKAKRDKEIADLKAALDNMTPRDPTKEYVKLPSFIDNENTLGVFPTHEAEENRRQRLARPGEQAPGPTQSDLAAALADLDRGEQARQTTRTTYDTNKQTLGIIPDSQWTAAQQAPAHTRENYPTDMPTSMEPDFTQYLNQFQDIEDAETSVAGAKYQRGPNHVPRGGRGGGPGPGQGGGPPPGGPGPGGGAPGQPPNGPQPPANQHVIHGNLNAAQAQALQQAQTNANAFANNAANAQAVSLLTQQQRTALLQAQQNLMANNPGMNVQGAIQAMQAGGPNGQAHNANVQAQIFNAPAVNAAVAGGNNNPAQHAGLGGAANPFVPAPAPGGGNPPPPGGAPVAGGGVGVAAANAGGNMPINKYGGRNATQTQFRGGKYSPEGDDGWGDENDQLDPNAPGGGAGSLMSSAFNYGQKAAGFGKNFKKTAKSWGKGLSALGEGINDFVNPLAGVVNTVGNAKDILMDAFGVREAREKQKRDEEEARYQERLKKAEELRVKQKNESSQERKRRLEQEKYDEESTIKKVVKDQYRAAQASQYGEENAYGNVHWEGSIEGGDRRLVSKLDDYQQQKKDSAARMAEELSGQHAYDQTAKDVESTILSNWELNNKERYDQEEEDLRRNLFNRGQTEGSPAFRKAMANLRADHAKERRNVQDQAVEQGHKYGAQAFEHKLKVYEKMDDFHDPLGLYKDTSSIGTEHIGEAVLPSLKFAGERADADSKDVYQMAELANQREKTRLEADARQREMYAQEEMQDTKHGYDSEDDDKRYKHEDEMQGGRFYHEVGMQNTRLENESDEQREERLLREEIAREDRRERAETAMNDRLSREQITQATLDNEERRENARLANQEALLDKDNYYKLTEGANNRGWKTSERQMEEAYKAQQDDIQRNFLQNESQLERSQKTQDLLDARQQETQERLGKEWHESSESKKERRRIRKTDYYRRLHEKGLQREHDQFLGLSAARQRQLERELQAERINADARNNVSDRNLKRDIAYNELNQRGQTDYQNRQLQRDLADQKVRAEEDLLYQKNKHEIAITEGKQGFLARENHAIRQQEKQNADTSFKIQKWLQEQNLRSNITDRNLKLNEAERLRLEEIDLTNNRSALEYARKSKDAAELLEQQAKYKLKIAKANAAMNTQLERVRAEIRGQEATEDQKRKIEQIIAHTQNKTSLYTQGMETVKTAFGVAVQMGDVYLRNQASNQAQAAAKYSQLLDKFNFLTGPNNRVQQGWIGNLLHPQSQRIYTSQQFDQMMGLI